MDSFREILRFNRGNKKKKNKKKNWINYNFCEQFFGTVKTIYGSGFWIYNKSAIFIFVFFIILLYGMCPERRTDTFCRRNDFERSESARNVVKLLLNIQNNSSLK
jgi:uncharacterized membrane protein